MSFPTPSTRARCVRSSFVPIALIALLAAATFVHASTARAAEPVPAAVSYPMTEGAWTLASPMAWAGHDVGKLSFDRYEGMPNGLMTVNEAVAVSRTAEFSSGTIDFDIKPLAFSDTGIIFRRRGNDDAEMVYLRADPDCPAANDCIQYAPITHGLMQWDIYPNFQSQAPISVTGWNHLHLVVAGSKMEVFVDHEVVPSLVVPKLQGITQSGGIAFKGAAIYANLVVTPGSPTLADVPDPAPAPGTLMNWSIAPPTTVAADRLAVPASIPADDWSPIAAESTGLVNFSRRFGSCSAPLICIAWMKTTVTAQEAVHRNLAVGYKDEVAVYVNGKVVYAGENAYHAKPRLSIEGRLEPDNVSVGVDLRKGPNVIVLAVANSWLLASGHRRETPYGWAAEVHIDDPSALVLP